MPVSHKEWIELRLRDKLKKNPRTGCWVWIGAVNQGGYGYMSVAIPGRKRRRALVHRLAAWLWLNMDLDDTRQEICHGCDNKRCCRPHPKHVRIGTRSQNQREAYERGLQPQRVGWQGHNYDRKGEGNPRAKLTKERAQEIRLLHELWNMTGVEIADRVGVSPSTVGRVIRGESWTDA